MKKILIGLVAAAAFALPTLVSAATVGNINTGDASYTVSGPGIAGTVAANNIIPHPNWATAPGGTSWIGTENGDVKVDAGNYLFTTTFDLTGYDHATASILGDWAIDNSAQFRLNGMLLQSQVGFGALSSFNLNTAFVAGLNMLEVLVFNADNRLSPMGLLIANSNIDARISAVPLPAALPLYGAGIAAMGLIGWSRKRKAARS